MANISRITDRIWTGGDLPYQCGPEAMMADLTDIRAAGITHIVDNRLEACDEDFVAAHAPEITYVWNGQDDAGQAMPDTWFSNGVGAALAALAQPDGVVLAHCHMGINRGPSMAFAIMLATGWDPVAALDAIRAARPIAAVGYSADSLEWWIRVSGTPEPAAGRHRAAVRSWHRAHPIDTVRIIRRFRTQEATGRPLSA
jgi:dual specificity phosphatase 3